MSSTDLVERAGGEAALRSLLEDFYARVFDDAMFGFFFRSASRERLVQKELELALQQLGADVEYTGRPLRAAHAVHRIFGGQFNRRLQILRETMADHGLPQDVQERWIEENLALRASITDNAAGECRPPEGDGA